MGKFGTYIIITLLFIASCKDHKADPTKDVVEDLTEVMQQAEDETKELIAPDSPIVEEKKLIVEDSLLMEKQTIKIETNKN